MRALICLLVACGGSKGWVDSGTTATTLVGESATLGALENPRLVGTYGTSSVGNALIVDVEYGGPEGTWALDASDCIKLTGLTATVDLLDPEGNTAPPTATEGGWDVYAERCLPPSIRVDLLGIGGDATLTSTDAGGGEATLTVTNIVESHAPLLVAPADGVLRAGDTVRVEAPVPTDAWISDPYDTTAPLGVALSWSVTLDDMLVDATIAGNVLEFVFPDGIPGGETVDIDPNHGLALAVGACDGVTACSVEWGRRPILYGTTP